MIETLIEMANTYTEVYVQIVFSTRKRNFLIDESFRDELQMYMTGIIQNHGHKVLAIYCRPDHCHIFLDWNVNQCVSDLVKFVKTGSTKWINKNGLTKTRFAWQTGYAAFTYSKEAKPNVIAYILNQKEHHEGNQIDFKQEYLDLLDEHGIDYDINFVFD